MRFLLINSLARQRLLFQTTLKDPAGAVAELWYDRKDIDVKRHFPLRAADELRAASCGTLTSAKGQRFP